MHAALTGSAVAIAVMAVLALGVLTTSPEGDCDGCPHHRRCRFHHCAEHTDDIINSSIDQSDLDAIAKLPGVRQATGALIETVAYDSANPTVIEVGLTPEAQRPFGLQIVAGRSYRADATDEIMLGYTLAKTVGAPLGSEITVANKRYRVVGLYRTNISFGNSTLMLPLTTLQSLNRLSGEVSLGFVKTEPGADIDAVRARIDRDFPYLTTVRTEPDFGRADRNLLLLSAANTGGSILAGLIAVTGVLNTSLLSFFERIREFGIYRSLGWTRPRVIRLVLGESILVSLGGAAAGLLLGWVAINVLQHLASLRGIFQPIYGLEVFIRALTFAVAVALLGSLYPALRAAFVTPMTAVRSE